MKSRGMLIASLAAAFVVASSVESFAQFRGGRGGFGGRGAGGPLSVVSNAAVQKDLGLNEDQTKKIAELNEELSDDRMKAFAEAQTNAGNLEGLSENERREKLGAALAEAMKKINDKYQPKLKEILEPKQLDRLKQIAWQAAGTAAYSDPEVVKALGISKEQEEKFAAINKERMEKMASAFRDGAGGGRERFQQMNEEFDKRFADVLSKEQQDKFTELKGKEFDVAQLRGGRGGRGGDRPEGARRRRASGSEEK